MERVLGGYFRTITVINLGLGTALAATTYVIGLPNPIVWGVLAFLSNYVPYIGAAVVLVMLLGTGLLQFDSVAYAMLAPALFLVLSTVEGQFVTPSVVGMRLALNPLLVFLAVVFWAWLWGPFGAVLAVPLLIVGIVALGHLFPNGQARLPG